MKRFSKKGQEKPKPPVQEILNVWNNEDEDKEIESDVLGSYTGNNKFGDYPEQDPDDL